MSGFMFSNSNWVFDVGYVQLMKTQSDLTEIIRSCAGDDFKLSVLTCEALDHYWTTNYTHEKEVGKIVKGGQRCSLGEFSREIFDKSYKINFDYRGINSDFSIFFSWDYDCPEKLSFSGAGVSIELTTKILDKYGVLK